MGYRVPDVLLSGDHKKIEEWRKEERIKRTFQKRPDLLNKKE
jgi:tRNA (guanine37-N1)-methyltransferase